MFGMWGNESDSILLFSSKGLDMITVATAFMIILTISLGIYEKNISQSLREFTIRIVKLEFWLGVGAFLLLVLVVALVTTLIFFGVI
jgi:hypothetical protein